MILEKTLRFIKKCIPKPLFLFFQPYYHLSLVLMAAGYYGFPSRRLKVIGVTGTSGKTTVVEMLFEIFSHSKYKAASMSGLYFRVNDSIQINNLKMTMPGRFRTQKFLYEAAERGCDYAFLEVTSEGIKQYRHKFIKFYAAIFTNLSPEHIEAHGGFENYRSAKGKLFEIAPIHILNGDDDNFDFFNKIPSKEKIVFRKNNVPDNLDLKIKGGFNKSNAAAALVFAKHENINVDMTIVALNNFSLPGRMEFVETGKDFNVLVDYAFIPKVLEIVYKEAIENSAGLVCVLGSAGGGRDKWKRPVLGDVAAKYCRKVIVTNEDPYDEDPKKIIDEVTGNHTDFEKELDRREAIKKALSSAQAGDNVVITGKGAEPWIMGPNGSKTPWDDRKVVKEELRDLSRD